MGVVRLTEEEHLLAAMAGVFRRVRSTAIGKKDNAGHTGRDPWSMEVEGCCAEMAAAKALGVYWTGQQGQGARDILGFEVRHTEHPLGRLRVKRHGDPDDVPFLLVVGAMGSYVVVGWMLGKDAKQEKWLDDPGNRYRGAKREKWDYWVPQAELHKNRPK